jgi:hypothetical protein
MDMVLYHVLSVFSALANNRLYKIVCFQFQGGLMNNRTQVFILVQAPLLKVIALCPTE